MQLSSSLAVSQNTRRVFHLPALIPEPSLSLCIQLPPPLGTIIPFFMKSFFLPCHLWELVVFALLCLSYHNSPHSILDRCREWQAQETAFGSGKAGEEKTLPDPGSDSEEPLQASGLPCPQWFITSVGLTKAVRSLASHYTPKLWRQTRGLMWASVHQELTGLGPWLEVRPTGECAMVPISPWAMFVADFQSSLAAVLAVPLAPKHLASRDAVNGS